MKNFWVLELIFRPTVTMKVMSYPYSQAKGNVEI